jgi:hypothetical protein
MLPLIDDLYRAEQARLKMQYADLIARFDALASELGIGDESQGPRVARPGHGGGTVLVPRFEAFLEIRAGVVSEIRVQDLTVERNGYQTDATWRPGREIHGGTEEARTLLVALRDGMLAPA